MKKIIVAYPDFFGDQNLLYLLQETLQDLDRRVRVVSIDGKEAFAEKTEFHILIIDPELHSWDWLNLLLWQKKQNPQIPVIIFSAFIKVQEGFESLRNDPLIFIFNDIIRLKDNFDKVTDILNQSKKRILFVDDDINILRSYERSLRNNPWKIYTVTDPHKAPAIITEKKIDLVVTDIRMPGMHGFELFATIRKMNKEIPIVVCSAHHVMKNHADIFFHNISSFLEKPVDMKALEETIRGLLI